MTTVGFSQLFSRLAPATGALAIHPSKVKTRVGLTRRGSPEATGGENNPSGVTSYFILHPKLAPSAFSTRHSRHAAGQRGEKNACKMPPPLLVADQLTVGPRPRLCKHKGGFQCGPSSD